MGLRNDEHMRMLIQAVNRTYFCTENLGIIFTFSHVDVSLLCVFWMSYVMSHVRRDPLPAHLGVQSACCVAGPCARRRSHAREAKSENKCAMEPHFAVSRLSE